MDLAAARRILGVAPGSSVADVERAFRAFAVRAHPDHGGDPADFQRAVQARDLLRSGPTAATSRPSRPAPVVIVRRRSVLRVVRDGLDRRHRHPRVI